MITFLTAFTTKTGTVRLSVLPDGGSLVSIRKVGYAQQTMTVPINSKDTVPITVILEHVAELPRVMTRRKQISPSIRSTCHSFG